MADFFSRNQAQVNYAQLKSYLQNTIDDSKEDSGEAGETSCSNR